MPLLTVIIGIAIVLGSLATILLNSRKNDKYLEKLEGYEEEIRNLKREVDRGTREFKELSEEKMNELENKVKDINRAGTLVESKIKEGQNIVRILENTIDKSSQIEVGGKSKNIPAKSKSLSKEEIINLYKKGLSIKEIASQTGNTLVEIQQIMGL